MHPLKLRAWPWNKKRMFFVGHIDFSKNEISGLWADDGGKETGVLPLDSCELLQFTGLYDMKGHEIYEGDIVDDTCGRIGIPQSTNVVKWNDKESAFAVFDVRSQKMPWKPHLLLVIGNVYEDADLLDK